MANLVQFKSCTQAKYNSLTTKDANALYFISDTGRMYKGDQLIAGDIKSFATLPASAATSGVLVFSQDTGIISYSNGTSWEDKFLPFENEISDITSGVPTSHAVLAMTSGAIGADPLVMDPVLVSGKFNTDYNSMKVASIDKSGNQQSQDALKQVKFIGDCKVSYGANGQVVVRIGQNLNSSNFNNDDGFADLGAATAQGSITGGGVTGTPASDYDGSSTTMLKSPATTINIVNSKKCHFDNNTSTTFKVTAYVGKDGAITETVLTLGPVTGNNTYMDSSHASDALSGVSLTITNFGSETKASEGATGYCANVSVSITTAAIDALAQNADIYFKVEHINGSEQTKPYSTGKVFVIDNDNDQTKPVINGDVTLTWTTNSTRQNSGVTYIKTGTASVSGTNIANLNTPGYVSSWATVTSFNNGMVAGGDVQSQKLSKTGNATTDTGSFAGGTFSTLTTGYYTTGLKATVKAKNCNGYGDTKNSNTINGPFNIDTTTKVTNGDKSFSFTDDQNNKRLNNDETEAGLTPFDATLSIENTDDLMVSCGKLFYPAGNQFGGEYAQTGNRYYVYKFVKSGSLTGAEINFAFNSGNLSNIGVQIMKGEGTWEYVNKQNTGAIPAGKTLKYATASCTNTKLVLVFDDTNANNGFYIRLSMAAGATAKVTSVTLV